MKIIGLMVLTFFLTAFAGKMHAVNFAVFHKVDKNMVFEDIVEGKHGEFLSNMEKQGAEILALTNVPHVMHNDVITLQTSALHDNAGELGDFGVDCHLNYKAEGSATDKKHYLGGVCKIIRQGRGQNIKKLVIMQHTPIIDSTQGFVGWVKIGENKELGVAFYATYHQ